LINFTEIAVKRENQVQNLILLNVTSYMLMMISISVIILSGAQGSIFDLQNFHSPLAINENLKNAGWISVL
jgi:hypothetical protein